MTTLRNTCHAKTKTSRHDRRLLAQPTLQFPVWCATWFDPATRQTRRASLGTTDFREAEIALADYVVQHAKPKDAKPEDTPLETVLLRYWNDHAKDLPSAEAERFGLRYWSELCPASRVAELTPERQERFIAALRDRGCPTPISRGSSARTRRAHPGVQAGRADRCAVHHGREASAGARARYPDA